MRTARLLLLAGLFCCGCWGSSSYTPIPDSVVAEATNVFSNSIPTGTAQVFVLGYYFTSETVIQWNGRPQRSTFVGRSAPGITSVDPTLSPVPLSGVRVDLDVDATKAAGTAQVTASNGSGPISGPLEVGIIDATFTFAGVSPAQLDTNSPATTLTLTGTGFRSDTQVFFDGAPLTATFVSSTSLTAQVPAAMLVDPGDRFVQLLQQPCTVTPTACDSVVQQSALLQIVSVGPAGTRLLAKAGRTSELVWDTTHSLLFGDIAPTGSQHLLASIDPLNGNLGTAASIALPDAVRLGISAQDQFLYTSGNFSSLQQYTLPGLTSVTKVGASGVFFAPAPDAAQTVAFAGFPFAGIVDGTTQRPALDNGIAGFETFALSWGADDSTLYGLTAISQDPVVFHVDASGIIGESNLTAAPFGLQSEIVFDRVSGRLYGSDGENYDAQGGTPRPFQPASPSASLTNCHMAIDGALGKAFFACIESTHTTVRSFDLTAQKFIARVVLSNGISAGTSLIPSFPLRLVRWGTNGLALGTTDGVYLYSGPFVQ
jgi:trimeric autotransporter adhesin